MHRSCAWPSFVCVIAPAICIPSQPAHASDFNGDGFADLVVGVSRESLPSATSAGAVHVIYGSAARLKSAGNQLWSQNSPGLSNTAENGDAFGGAVCGADFNHDGFDDLAVSAYGKAIGGAAGAGAVYILYGSASGLTSVGNKFFNQNSSGIANTAGAGDTFGRTLATADFDGDGFADLAIGIPGETIDGQPKAGAVEILYGSSSGLRSARSQFFSQNSPGVLDVAEIGDSFGAALASGDFNGDGRADLAIGVPFENVSGIVGAGAVNILYGSASGLTATSNQFWTQDSASVKDVAEAGDFFGQSLAAGDFNGDGRADLAIGVPFEDLPGAPNAGAVNVLYGSSAGLSAAMNQFWTQNSTGILDSAEADDAFGFALVAGDFNGDGRADLAIGVPFEDIGEAIDCGAVNIIYGSPSGLTATGNKFISQNTTGIVERCETGDLFGIALAAADYNGDHKLDLAIGVIGETIGEIRAGAVNVIYGSVNGLTSTGNQLWSQNSSGITGACEANDGFGVALR